MALPVLLALGSLACQRMAQPEDNKFADSPDDSALDSISFVDQDSSQVSLYLRESQAEWVVASIDDPSAGSIVLLSRPQSNGNRTYVVSYSDPGATGSTEVNLDSDIASAEMIVRQGKPLLVLEPLRGDTVVTDVVGAPIHAIGETNGVLSSPSRKHLAFFRSRQIEGLHNLFVLNSESLDTELVCAIEEADPGSGKSFSLSWSSDSRYLRLEGHHYSRSGPTAFAWIYDTTTGELVALSNAA